MKSSKLFGISAIFNTPDQILSAASKVAEHGYKKYDVYTPYPVHGLDKAMKLPPSKLGYLTLIFGLSGASFALLFMFWAMSINYPMVIGGKPFFALPAFIPVTFEVTVLLATLATVIGLLTFFFNYPFNSHPLHDTDFMKKVSLDKYGVCIEAEDADFEVEKIKNLLLSLSGMEIREEYYPEEKTHTVMEPKFIGLLLVVFIVVSGGTYFSLNKLLYITPFDWMMNQDRLDVQSASTFFKDDYSMRMPVDGTVARGFMPYQNKGIAVPSNDSLLINPILPSKQNIELGKKRYLTFCSPCHGNFGDGDSRLGEFFPKPPSLHSSKLREWPDGMIYHVIVNGQNVMPSYEIQIPRDERWAIINYIRVLQKAKNATLEDIQSVRKSITENGKSQSITGKTEQVGEREEITSNGK